MFQFANPSALYLLLLIPILALGFVAAQISKRKIAKVFAQDELFNKLSNANERTTVLKASLFICGIFFLILALARPQFGTKLIELERTGSDVVIALDVSKSMLAQDIKPSRFERAKNVLSELINRLEGDRIGIVAFAGASFWQCPLTLDRSGAAMFLQILDTNLIPLAGTSIGKAISLSLSGLEKTAPKAKAIVLLTDGEDHNSGPIDAAKSAAASGVKIFVIGFGKANGEPIPVEDENGNFTGYKKDSSGQVVMSKLNEELLSQIASITGGAYIRSVDGYVDTDAIARAVNGLDKQKLSSKMNRQLVDRFQYFLALALLCFLIEFILPQRKKKQI
ncbi:MAG: VWA domain-containing protein [Endomicrobiales bacterium]|nr:VWA domain-containing protein [Endomicrobiales bacterium]